VLPRSFQFNTIFTECESKFILIADTAATRRREDGGYVRIQGIMICITYMGPDFIVTTVHGLEN